MAKKISVGSGSSKGIVSNDSALTTGLSSPNFHLPFFHYLTIDKNTVQASYASYKMILPIGQINRLWIEFPKGCSGLAGFQLWRGVRQIFPLPEGNWIVSDGAVMNFAFTHQIDTEPYEVELRGYNNDDTFPHTIWIALEMSGMSSDLPPQLQSFFDTLKG